ncbi:MAG: hypothetical protein AAFX58_13835, partial [Pseudomonadota bacterium]
MKFLTPTLHGLGDYAAALVLITAPFVLGIAEQSALAHWASVAGGVSMRQRTLRSIRKRYKAARRLSKPCPAGLFRKRLPSEA